MRNEICMSVFPLKSLELASFGASLVLSTIVFLTQEISINYQFQKVEVPGQKIQPTLSIITHEVYIKYTI